MTKVSRRNFLAGSALAVVGGSLALVGCSSGGNGSSVAHASNAKEQAWLASAVGKGGTIEVEVVTNGESISRINVLQARESFGVGDVAMDTLKELIVENQTLNVDTITGATVSSMAFNEAVTSALDEAGFNTANWKKKEKASLALPDDLETKVDVVVVGAGGAGYAAAITAALEGKKVVLLEKLGIPGGSTILSGAAMAVPGNWFQKAEGIEDSPQKLAEDMLVGGDNIGDPELINTIAQGASETLDWLIFEGGVAWQPYQRFFGGHSVARALIPMGNHGGELIRKLDKRAHTIEGLTVLCNTKVESLTQDSSGAISGIEATHILSGEKVTLSAKAVILASGGFGSNVEMRVKHNPDMDKKILSTDSVGATGDGHTMAEKIGADLLDMQYIQTYPTCDTQTGALLYVANMRLEARSILVNKEGKRFVEELERRDVISNKVKNQTDGIAYLVFNQALADETDILTINESEYESLEARGQIVKADTLEEASKTFGIDVAALKATLDTWNQFCKDGKDADFNFRGKLNAIEGGPYYILACKPAVHYTMGGLHINTEAEVLDKKGAPIKGLYAAGEVAGHKMGTNRLGSCSITDIFVFGRIAGKNAASIA